VFTVQERIFNIEVYVRSLSYKTTREELGRKLRRNFSMGYVCIGTSVVHSDLLIYFICGELSAYFT
jgi:hypothetical protein